MRPFCDLLVNPLVVVGGSLHLALVGEDAEGFFLFPPYMVLLYHAIVIFQSASNIKIALYISANCIIDIVI